MLSKNILIVCWDFPPHDAIGGRRWAKMAKSFLKLNYHVSVITSTLIAPPKKISWIEKEEFEKINMHYVTSHFLVSWLNDYSSPFKFLKIRLARLLLSIFDRGTIFDRAIGIEKSFLKLVADVVKKNNVETIFVTGAPFNLVYYTSKLKAIFPNIKIIADYRDPWINAQNYGMQNLSPGQKRNELQKQNYVVEQVDYITAPNTFLLNEIKSTYTGNGKQIAKFIELPHAFDPDDVIVKEVPAKKTGKIKIVYGGTLYIGIDNYLIRLNEAISYLKQNYGDVQVELCFYTNELDKKSLFASNSDCVTFSKSVGDNIFEEILQADFILILLSEHNKNYVTSKYFEFLPYKKPYLYVGPKGFVADKIEQEGFGYYLNDAKDLHAIIVECQNKKVLSHTEIHKYTFDAVTHKFLQYINGVS